MSGLFYSPTTQQILTILCDQPAGKFHVNELIRLTGRYPNSVQHALKGLEKHKLVISSRSGRLKLYQINNSHPIYPELKSIFSKLYTFVEQKLRPLEERPISWLKLLNRPSHMALMYANYKAYRDEIKRYLAFSFQYGWQNGVTGGIYQAKEETLRFGRILSGKVKADSKFAQKIIYHYQKSVDNLLNFSKKLPFPTKLKKCSNNKLSSYLEKFLKHYYVWLPFLTIPFSLEYYLEKWITEELETKLKQKREGNLIEDYLSLFKTTIQEIPERKDALHLASFVQKHNWNNEAKQKLEKHTQKYCWLPLWYLSEKPLSEKYFKEEISELARTIPDISQELRSAQKQKNENKTQISKAIKHLNLSLKFTEHLTTLHELIRLRTHRRHTISHAHFLHLPLLYETAKRLGMSFDNLLLLTYEEMIKGLRERKLPSKTTLIKRKQGSAILLWQGKIKIISGQKEIIETMERYRIVSCGEEDSILHYQIKQPFNSHTTSVKSKKFKKLKGKTAYPGMVTGITKIIKTRDDLQKIKEGDIIVTQQAEPSYLSSLYKAGGLIVDEPDTSSHATLYAQSLKLPTIIGTKTGTEVLKDNEKVQLNANKGVVVKLT